MKEFKEWWSDQEIFAGEGAMDAAEQAWDELSDTIAKMTIELSELRSGRHDARVRIEALRDISSEIWRVQCSTVSDCQFLIRKKAEVLEKEAGL